MRGINRVTLLGNLGADPEIRQTKGGIAVANLSLATSYRDSDGNDHTEWHKLVLWDKLAGVAEQYLSKGDPIYAEGPLTYRKWETKEGVSRVSAEIRVRELRFGFGGRGERAMVVQEADEEAPKEYDKVEEWKPDDELPF